jgi:chromate transporter
MVDQNAETAGGSVCEVFTTFLKLGFTSFGGPIAHLGYYHEELVRRRRWLDEQGYADLVALCQFLPGPASSQVGFAMGLMRAGPLGAAAAWIAFTLPSALLMVLFAFGVSAFEGPVGSGLINGLKIVAVAIVAQAVWGMSRSLCADRQRATIALVSVLAVTLVGGSAGQLAAIIIGGVAGLLLCRNATPEVANHLGFPVSRRVGVSFLALFFFLLLGLPLMQQAASSQALALFDAFYRSGALVFGGGHVVLPLLEAEVVRPGWVSADAFLAGYGAAQAVPGPLFSFAAYLGMVLTPEPNGLLGAVIALIAIFLPGFLLLLGVMPFWNAFRRLPLAQSVMMGANAAVVGILGAALYDPVWTSSVTSPHAFALALACFVMLTVWKLPSWLVVLVGAFGGVLIKAF